MLVAPAFAAGSANALIVLASSFKNDGMVDKIEIAAGFDTEAEAVAFAAKFPKSCGIKGGTIGNCDLGSGWIRCTLRFTADGANKGKNETAIKRFQSIVKNAEKHGVTLICDNKQYANQIMGLDTILAAL